MRHKKPVWLKPAQGLSMVELMLGIALSLGVMLAALLAYQTMRASWLAMQSIDAMHHNANAALDNLQIGIQGAGAMDLITDANGLVDLSSHPTNAWGVTEGPQQSDSLWVSHPRMANPLDCQGNRTGNHKQIRNSYQRNNKQELTCKDLHLPGATYQALAEGVENFQVRFAQRNEQANAAAAPSVQWKRADEVALAGDVVAIEVCLRLVSATVIQTTDANVIGCDNEKLVHDGKLRRVFRRLFAIRSNISTLP